MSSGLWRTPYQINSRPQALRGQSFGQITAAVFFPQTVAGNKLGRVILNFTIAMSKVSPVTPVALWGTHVENIMDGNLSSSSSSLNQPYCVSGQSVGNISFNYKYCLSEERIYRSRLSWTTIYLL